MSTQINIRIDEELIEYVRDYCRNNERSTGFVVREALRLWRDEQEALGKRGDGKVRRSRRAA
jgi:hypothetical protein